MESTCSYCVSFLSLPLSIPCPLLILPVDPSYSLSDFLIESVSIRKQLEQEGVRHEYEVASSTSPSFPTPSLPTKHQLISCLAARGHWVTTQPCLQLDPPDSQQLMLKGASLHFLFEPAWLLSGAHQGDFLHMLKNVLNRLEDNTFKLVFVLLHWYGMRNKVRRGGAGTQSAVLSLLESVARLML